MAGRRLVLPEGRDHALIWPCRARIEAKKLPEATMRALTSLALAVIATTTLVAPALALTVTARVSGGNIAIHAGPDDRFQIVGYVREGQDIQVDYCTQTDSDSRRGSWIGDAGHTLWPANATQWCRIPDQGWVDRSYIVGRGLVNVTPPDFVGPGW
jgi:hypothetical protein